MRAERVELHLGAGGVAAAVKVCSMWKSLSPLFPLELTNTTPSSDKPSMNTLLKEVPSGVSPLGNPQLLLMTKRLLSASATSCIQANASNAAASSTISVAKSNSDAGAMPVSGSSASARRDASHVGAVGGVPVHVGRVAAQELISQAQRGDPVVEASALPEVRYWSQTPRIRDAVKAVS